jgi:hypothetical protein
MVIKLTRVVDEIAYLMFVSIYIVFANCKLMFTFRSNAPESAESDHASNTTSDAKKPRKGLKLLAPLHPSAKPQKGTKDQTKHAPRGSVSQKAAGDTTKGSKAKLSKHAAQKAVLVCTKYHAS